MSSSFTGFVLLNEAKFDRDKFLKDLKEDWKITLNLGEEDESKEKDMLVGDIDGRMQLRLQKNIKHIYLFHF